MKCVAEILYKNKSPKSGSMMKLSMIPSKLQINSMNTSQILGQPWQKVFLLALNNHLISWREVSLTRCFWCPQMNLKFRMLSLILKILKAKALITFQWIWLRAVMQNSVVFWHIWIIGRFLDGVFPPDALKVAKVIPVYESDDVNSVSNYRPISVLTTFSKITKKLVCTRLNKFLSDNAILHSSQFCFQRKIVYSYDIIKNSQMTLAGLLMKVALL